MIDRPIKNIILSVDLYVGTGRRACNAIDNERASFFFFFFKLNGQDDDDDFTDVARLKRSAEKRNDSKYFTRIRAIDNNYSQSFSINKLRRAIRLTIRFLTSKRRSDDGLHDWLAIGGMNPQ